MRLKRIDRRRKKDQSTQIEQGYYTNKSDQLPDFIEGRWTEPNSNPVKFVYTYKSGTRLPNWFNLDTDAVLSSEIGKYWVTGVVGAIMGTGLLVADWLAWHIPALGNAISDAYEASWVAGKGVMAKVLSGFFSELATWADTAFAAWGFYTATAMAAFVLAEYNIGFKAPYENWKRKIQEAKTRCDNSWDDEEEEYEIKGATITMTANYGVDIVGTWCREWKPFTPGFDDHVVVSEPLVNGIDTKVWQGLKDVQYEIKYKY